MTFWSNSTVTPVVFSNGLALCPFSIGPEKSFGATLHIGWTPVPADQWAVEEACRRKLQSTHQDESLAKDHVYCQRCQDLADRRPPLKVRRTVRWVLGREYGQNVSPAWRQSDQNNQLVAED